MQRIQFTFIYISVFKAFTLIEVIITSWEHNDYIIRKFSIGACMYDAKTVDWWSWVLLINRDCYFQKLPKTDLTKPMLEIIYSVAYI